MHPVFRVISQTPVFSAPVFLFFLIAVTGVAIYPCSSLAAEDEYIGYYYPQPAEIEVFDSRARRMAQSNRHLRIGFIVGIVDQTLKRPFPPPASVFVKGDRSEKMIIVANTPGYLDTVYRVRAYLDTLTSVARTMPIFAEMQVEDVATFLDFLKILGFTQLTVSDGNTFSHQIEIR